MPFPGDRETVGHSADSSISRSAVMGFLIEPLTFQFQGVHFPMIRPWVKDIESAEFQAPQCPEGNEDSHTEKAECRDEDSGSQVQPLGSSKSVSIFLYERRSSFILFGVRGNMDAEYHPFSVFFLSGIAVAAQSHHRQVKQSKKDKNHCVDHRILSPPDCPICINNTNSKTGACQQDIKWMLRIVSGIMKPAEIHAADRWRTE